MKTIDIIAGILVIAAVVLLGVVALAGPQATPPPPELEVTVDIIRDEPEPQPEPPRPEPPPPETEPEPTPQPAPPEPDDAPGALPPLRANYRRYVGFQRYAEGMFRAGADFYVTGAKRDTLLKINFGTGSLNETSVSTIVGRGYSPRTRVISDEPALQQYLDLARTKHGSPDPEVILLIPQRLETRLARKLHAALKQQGARLHDVTSLRGVYRLNNNRLILHIQQAYTADKTCRLNLPIRI